MNYYEHHLGDYDGATAHLSWLEDCAYRRMIGVYYRNEAPLPLDIKQVFRLIRAASKAEREAVEQVLHEFFEAQHDGYHQRRCDTDIERFQDRQRKAKASANKRWGNAGNDGGSIANDMPSDMPSHMQTHSEGNANGMHRAPVPSLQTPNNYVEANASTPFAGLPQKAAHPPPSPPPDFDGNNATALNGKSLARIAQGFELPADWGLDAEALGYKAEEVLREAERFRQYWTAGKGSGKRRTVRGWRQTWSNWLEKASRDHR